MSDTFLPVLAAIVARLQGDATLNALVPADRIYSNTPDNPQFPYAVLYITSAPFDTKTETGMQHTVQVSVFDRQATPSLIGGALQRVYELLHRQQATMAAAGIRNIVFTGSNPVFRDPDGKSWQGVRQFIVTIN